jgi:hypothetical protein
MSEYTSNDILPVEFNDIAPYDDRQFREKIAQLVKEDGFEHAIRYVMPNVDYAEFTNKLLSLKTQSEFQHIVMGQFLEFLAASTTDGITIDGLENIKPDRSHSFITNHRDIVLDASFLNLCFIRTQKPLTQVAIGNNLLIYEWISDLVKLNRSFIVKRDVKMVKALEAAKQLSAYIHFTINNRHESIWIAQREGRAKDSSDCTQESLVKMFALAGNGDTKANILDINLTPTAISYEYDPNDYLKAREFLLRRRDPEYKKTRRDDLFSMETGILQPKGRIHFHVGECINDKLIKSTEVGRAEVIHETCQIIDKTIHSGYKIYPGNYIAYDEINCCHKFVDKYNAADVDRFNEYIESHLNRVDVENITSEERDYMRNLMLTMYANPLKNQLAALDNQ